MFHVLSMIRGTIPKHYIPLYAPLKGPTVGFRFNFQLSCPFVSIVGRQRSPKGFPGASQGPPKDFPEINIPKPKTLNPENPQSPICPGKVLTIHFSCYFIGGAIISKKQLFWCRFGGPVEISFHGFMGNV